MASMGKTIKQKEALVGWAPEVESENETDKGTSFRLQSVPLSDEAKNEQELLNKVRVALKFRDPEQKNLDERIIKAVCKTKRPDLQQLKTIATIVKSFIDHDTGNKDKSVNEELVLKKASLVTETILENYPKRPFYQLLVRWGRRRKGHFLKDSLNSLNVIHSQLSNEMLSSTLSQCRTLKLCPPTRGREKLLCAFVSCPRIGKGKAHIESVATKIDILIRIMYATISTMKDISLSQIRMNSVRKATNFKLGEQDLVNEIMFEDDQEDDIGYVTESEFGDQNDNNILSLETEPILAFHTPNSFLARLWLNIRYLRLGYELFKVIFKSHIIEKNLYKKKLGKQIDERVLQFFLASMCQESTRYMYISRLAKLSLMFHKVNLIHKGYKDFFNDLDEEGKERNLPLATEKFSFCKDDEVNRIVEAFQSFKPSVKAFSLRKEKRKKTKGNVLDFIRVHVFDIWICRFKCNEKLRQSVHKKLYGRKKTSANSRVTRKRKKVPKIDTPSDDGSTISDDDHPDASKIATLSNIDNLVLSKLNFRVKVDESSDGKKNDTGEDEDQQTEHPCRTKKRIVVPTNGQSPQELKSRPTYNAYISRTILQSPGAMEIASLHGMKKIYSSFFVDTGCKLIRLDTHNVEVYSARLLAVRNHWRSRDHLPGGVVLHIPANVTQYVDDDLSVVRPEGDLFCQHEDTLETNFEAMVYLFDTLVQTMPTKADGKRRIAANQRSIQFGVKPEIPQAYGMEILNIATKRNPKLTAEARKTVGNVLDFMWGIGNSIQEKLQRPSLGGSSKQNKESGSVLRDMFGCKKSEFEHLDVLLWIIDPETGDNPFCYPHVDKLNDTLPTYSKTLCTNISFQDSQGVVFFFQFIANFRKHPIDNVDQKVKLITENIEYYELCLWNSYRKAFVDSVPVNTQYFYLDDNLPWKEYFISRNSAQEKHCQSLLLLPIGTCRTLSLSGFIAPLHIALNHFHIEQVLQLCFSASFFATPVLFNYGMKVLLERRKQEALLPYDPNAEIIAFPMVDLFNIIKEEFGAFQGGIEPRYSAASNSVLAVLKLTGLQQEDAINTVMHRLLEWIYHIDTYSGKIDAKDVPANLLWGEMNAVIRDIQHIYREKTGSMLDFSKFRLSIFTNLITALGYAVPGRHLNQLFLPTPGTASFSHLTDPTMREFDVTRERMQYGMGEQQTNFEAIEIDDMMRKVCDQLQWEPYLRNMVEVHLCESVSGRLLKRNDVFFKNQTIHRLTEDGVPQVRQYGRFTNWRDIEPPEDILRYREHRQRLLSTVHKTS